MSNFFILSYLLAHVKKKLHGSRCKVAQWRLKSSIMIKTANCGEGFKIKFSLGCLYVQHTETFTLMALLVSISYN